MKDKKEPRLWTIYLCATTAMRAQIIIWTPISYSTQSKFWEVSRIFTFRWKQSKHEELINSYLQHFDPKQGAWKPHAPIRPRKWDEKSTLEILTPELFCQVYIHACDKPMDWPSLRYESRRFEQQGGRFLLLLREVKRTGEDDELKW